MTELFERAKRDGLWFYLAYQGLWFSPAELAREQANGRFRWGPVNWRLRDPQEHVAQLRDEAKKLNEQADSVERRIALVTR